MYNWNKHLINQQIKYLTDINTKNTNIEIDIELLKELKKKILPKINIKEMIDEEKEEYKILKSYKKTIQDISNKYKEIEFKQQPYTEIKTSKEEIIDFIEKTLKNINKEWYTTLIPIINNKDILNFKKNNTNYVCYLNYLNTFYISLAKDNDVEDFIAPIHEYLHIYSTIINPKSFYSIECEFLSILGELITSYEMKKNNLYKEEVIKSEINTLLSIQKYIENCKYRFKTITKNIKNNNKINYLKNNYNLSKKAINNIYSENLFTNYSYIISYFLAVELFEIYKIDKEKCMYLCNKIITDNNDINLKLAKYNITLLKKDNHYIKKLKKEYKSIDNL